MDKDNQNSVHSSSPLSSSQCSESWLGSQSPPQLQLLSPSTCLARETPRHHKVARATIAPSRAGVKGVPAGFLARLAQYGLQTTGKAPRDYQMEPVIASAQGYDVFVVAPTGSGKSMFLPLLTFEYKGVFLMPMPLNALMNQQVKKDPPLQQ